MEDIYEDVKEDKNNINDENSKKKEDFDNLNIPKKESNKKVDIYENEIIGENNNNEEENQKFSTNEIIEINSNPIERRDTIKIIGDEEIKTNFNNNSYYLGNLFMDIVNKYDEENDLKEKRRYLGIQFHKKRK